MVHDRKEGFLNKEIIEIPARHIGKPLFVLMALVITISAIYVNTLEAPFHFDDRANILENQAIRIHYLDFDNVWRVVSSHPRRAFSMLTFAVNHHFGGYDTTGYHFVNITIHAISSFFLFLLIHKTLELPSMRLRYPGNAFPIAILSTFLWALNPIHTQAITYIVQRMASMASMFYVISMYFYLKARTSRTRNRQISHIILCIFAGLLAVLSKENTAVLPIAILLYDLFLIQGVSRKLILKNLHFILGTLLAVSLISFAVILTVEKSHPFLSGYDDRMFTMIDRLLTQPRILVFYISLLLYPSPERLTIGHDMVISHSLFVPWPTVPAIMAVLLMLSFVIYYPKKYPLICYSIIFFFINHLVESTFIPLELIFEHRNYLPSMLIFVPIAVLLCKGFDYFANRRVLKGGLAIVSVCLITGMAHGTYLRNHAWQSEVSLWRDAVKKAPEVSRNHVNLGIEYMERKQIHRAIYHFQKSIELGNFIRESYRYHGYALLGESYLKLNRPKEAIYWYRIANAIRPTPSSYNNLAIAYLKTGDETAARKCLLKSLSLEETAQAHINLGYLLLRERELDGAISELKKAIEQDTTLNDARFYLGMAHILLHNYSTAGTYLRNVLRNERNPHSKTSVNATLGLIQVYHRLEKKRELRKIVDSFVRSIVMKNQMFDRLMNDFGNPDGLYQKLLDMKTVLRELQDGLSRLERSIKVKRRKLIEMTDHFFSLKYPE